jgi:single-strand selective monofunctional uracil DNA glycosylase
MTQRNRAEIVLEATERLNRSLGQLDFRPPVDTIYNPLVYAGDRYTEYITRYGRGEKHALLVGMNPGPWGMAQTGVPFGEVSAVKDWLGIEGPVDKPEGEIPGRPVTGFDCHRSEVSGRRVWGLMRERYGTPERFFDDHLVLNYCPLLFYSVEGKNITPDRLKKEDRLRLFRHCDDYLITCIGLYAPRYLVGFGNFAAGRLDEVLEEVRGKPEARRNAEAPWNPKGADPGDIEVVTLLHPSPANPRANRGWAEQAEKILIDSGVWGSG